MDKHRLLDELAKLDCNNLVAFEPENIFYLTGFWGEAIAVLNNDLRLIVPKLEADRAKEASKGRCKVIESERGSEMLNTLADLSGNTCTDCNDYNIFERMNNIIKGKVICNRDIFYKARRIKDENEIAIISQASKILDYLFGICEKEIRVGMSEIEIQALLLHKAMERGAYPTSYRFTLAPLIIASGKNSSLPHAEPSKRKVRSGDLVTIDLTLRYKGYIADATRTFGIGKVEQEKRKIYEIVREAQEVGLDKVRAGAKCSDIDRACRDIIEKNGYGRYFIHSTGHGIGLEVHEPPWLRSKNEELLESNMAITIEPGIYLPERYGVRIEDSVIVGRRARVLNKYTKDLVIL